MKRKLSFQGPKSIHTAKKAPIYFTHIRQNNTFSKTIEDVISQWIRYGIIETKDQKTIHFNLYNNDECIWEVVVEIYDEKRKRITPFLSIVPSLQKQWIMSNFIFKVVYPYMENKKPWYRYLPSITVPWKQQKQPWIEFRKRIWKKVKNLNKKNN